MSDQKTDLVNEVLDEEAVCGILGINKATMAELRLRKNIPYIPINRIRRVYLAADVLEWLKELRRTPE